VTALEAGQVELLEWMIELDVRLYMRSCHGDYSLKNYLVLAFRLFGDLARLDDPLHVATDIEAPGLDDLQELQPTSRAGASSSCSLTIAA
jgi:hypothetical protein